MDFELEQTTRVDRDFVEKLPFTTAIISEPFMKAVSEGRKLRIIVDYDPADGKITFSYFRSSSLPAPAGYQ